MRAHFPLLGLAAAVLVAWLIGSCAESPTDVPIPNQRPTVAISAGPIRDSVSVFIVTFNWNASDTDGQVEGFNYAIDDTLSPDAWLSTPAYELTLLFTAPDSAGVDSIFVGLSDVPLLRYRFRGAHTFFLKAIDDDGAVSPPAAISFTAETVAPETQIIIPSTSVIVELGPTFTVSWEGIDLDGTENPVAYSYRIVPVDNVVLVPPDALEALLFDANSPGDPWSPFEARTSVPIQNLAIPQDYIFGVVALDQAGAVEPRLRTPESPGPTNTLRIRARQSGGIPELSVSSSVKTTTFPTADERKKTFQIPANSNVTFTWTADASRYGGRVTGYSYGTDLLDPFGDDPGWSPESATTTRAVLRFDVPPGGRTEEHILYVRARDDVGTTIIADVTLVVVPLTRERDVLYIDDFGPDTRGQAPDDCIPRPPEDEISNSDFPHDQCHDQYIRESIAEALAQLGHPDWVVDRYEPLDPRTGILTNRSTVDIDSTSNSYWIYSGPVTLQQMARYRLIVWNTKSETTTQLTKMNLEGEDNFLAVYIESGGPVLLMGTGAYSRTRYRSEGVGLAPFGMRPRDMSYDFLKIESIYEGADCRNGCFRTSGRTTALKRVHGWDGAYRHPRAITEGYPELMVSRPPFSNPIAGIPDCEAMVVPLGLDINPRLRVFGGQVDTLYFYISNAIAQLPPPNASYMDDGACALRYSGPGQGRLMMFGFPIYFCPPEQVIPLMATSIRWLVGE